LEWAGIAVVKKTYRLFQERSSRVRLLSGAFRNDLHWSEIIGGDMVITIPYRWQKRFNNSDIEVISRIDKPVDQMIIAELSRKLKDFRKAYDEDGMAADEFETYPLTRRTLRQFISAYEDLVHIIRDFIIPNPDIK
jgi:transaldolase